jgi:lactoylglutathione lyase
MSANAPSVAGTDRRAQPESFRARSLTASLTVKDLEKSLAWYRDVIGFTVSQRHEREGRLVAISLKAGSVELLIGRDDGAKGWDRVKGEGLSLQLTTTQSIDELAARIKANGGTLVTEPTDMPWGVRVFRAQDPDGFKFVFSSVRPSTAE